MQRFDTAATERLLDYPTLMATLTTVLREYSRQEITSPERLVLPCGNGRGVLLSMPCQAHDLIAHKLVTIYKNNKEAGLPTIQGDVTGVVRIQVTREAELALVGRMMAPSRFQRWCEYRPRCWRSSEAARE